MTGRTCAFCSQTRVNKMCAGCRNIHYCNKTCQSADWTRHIFDCNPRRPITTADHLALAVRNKHLPLNQEALNDWGLEKAMTTISSQAARDLFAVYVDLIEVGGIKPRHLHQWRVQGRLANEIQAFYEVLPPVLRDHSKQYSWFLQHQHILREPDVNDSGDTEEWKIVDRMYRRLWLRLGRSPAASPEEIVEHVKSLPPFRAASFQFYSLCLDGCIPPAPSPISPLYLEFGFGACRSPQEHTDLMCSYGDLTDLATYEEFHEAFSTGKLLHLFLSKNVLLQLPYTRLDALSDILGSPPNAYKTVWELQRWLAQDPDHPLIRGLPLTAAVDYGYKNCEGNSSWEGELSHLYREFFAREDSDLLKLHKACMDGRLLAFFERDMKVDFGRERESFKRLLRPTTSGSRLTM